MASLLSEIAEAISRGVNQMVSTSGGVDTYKYDGNRSKFTDNNIEFITEPVMLVDEGVSKMQLSWRKLGEDKVRKVIVEMSIHRQAVITCVKQGDLGGAYMYAKAKDHNELPRLRIERWKQKPCMHGGVPNKNAMRLLTGLRKRVSPGYLVTKDGTIYRDRNVGGLVEYGLLANDGVMIRGVNGLRTTLAGYEVLSFWAERSKAFAPFLKAFCPENWERDHIANMVMDTMQGGKEPDVDLPPFFRAVAGSAGGMSSPPYARR